MRTVGRFVSLLFVILFAMPTLADEAEREYRITSAFIYNFAKFVQWPESSLGSEMVICIVGRSPLSKALEPIRKKSVRGRSIDIRTITSNATLERCQIAFIDQNERESVKGILTALRGKSVLTVSNAEGFVEAGGMFGLSLADGKMKLRINLDSTSAADLKVSARLMKLATVVKGK